MSSIVFESTIVIQTFNTIINKMINKFKTIILFLQEIIKKISFLMQNITTFILIFNIYILREFNIFAHLIISILMYFLC
jgi:hypothetical protein